MHRTPAQEPGDEDLEDYEASFGEEDLGDTELDRDDTHGLPDEVAERRDERVDDDV